MFTDEEEALNTRNILSFERIIHIYTLSRLLEFRSDFLVFLFLRMNDAILIEIVLRQNIPRSLKYEVYIHERKLGGGGCEYICNTQVGVHEYFTVAIHARNFLVLMKPKKWLFLWVRTYLDITIDKPKGKYGVIIIR